VAAVVNGDTVDLDQVDATLKARPITAGPVPPAQLRLLRLAVLDGLIDDLLLRQFVDKHGPKVDAAEIDGHLKGLAEALAKQGKRPADYYRETGQTEAEVRQAWTALLSFHKYATQVGAEAELRAYFAANRDVFDRTTVRASILMGRAGPAASPGERVAAREKLNRLKADIAAGTVTFADAARKHSLDPSAPAGGDLGPFARRDLHVDPEVARAAFAAKPGELVGPVDTEFGPALVLVTERTPGKPAAFEQVAEWVKDCYADDLRTRLAAKLRKEGRVEVLVP
jgi:parvulin-like peptidyl-prolyl isomerase